MGILQVMKPEAGVQTSLLPFIEEGDDESYQYIVNLTI